MSKQRADTQTGGYGAEDVAVSQSPSGGFGEGDIPVKNGGGAGSPQPYDFTHGYKPTQQDLKDKQSLNGVLTGAEQSASGGGKGRDFSVVNSSQLSHDQWNNLFKNQPAMVGAQKERQQKADWLKQDEIRDKPNGGKWSNAGTMVPATVFSGLEKDIGDATQYIGQIMPGFAGIGASEMAKSAHNAAKKDAAIAAANPLPNTEMGRLSTQVTGMLPIATELALTPEFDVAKIGGLAGKAADVALGKFPLQQGAQGLVNNYADAKAKGKSNTDANIDALGGAVKGYLTGVGYELGGKAASKLTEYGGKALEKVGLMSDNKFVAGTEKRLLNAAAQGITFSALPIVQNAVQGKATSLDEIKQNGLFGAVMGGLLPGEEKKPDEPTPVDKASADILQRAPLVDMGNFMEADMDAIKNIHESPITSADYRAKSTANAEEGFQSGDPEQKQEKIVQSSVNGKAAGVKSVTEAILKDKDAVIAGINELPISDEQKQPMIDKVNQVHKELDPVEQQKTAIGKQITDIDTQIAGIGDNADPVEQSKKRVLLQKQKDLNNQLDELTLNQQSNEKNNETGQKGQENEESQAGENGKPNEAQGLAAEEKGNVTVTGGEEPPVSKTPFFSHEGQDEFYHASSKERIGRLKPQEAPQFGKGVYFSTDENIVKDEFGDKVTKAKLKIEKPLYTNSKDMNAVTKLAAKLYNETELTYDEDSEEYRDKNGKTKQPAEANLLDENLPRSYVNKAARQLGYDAIIDTDKHQYGNEIVVLDESKIHYPEDEPPVSKKEPVKKEIKYAPGIIDEGKRISPNNNPEPGRDLYRLEKNTDGTYNVFPHDSKDATNMILSSRNELILPLFQEAGAYKADAKKLTAIKPAVISIEGGKTHIISRGELSYKDDAKEAVAPIKESAKPEGPEAVTPTKESEEQNAIKNRKIEEGSIGEHPGTAQGENVQQNEGEVRQEEGGQTSSGNSAKLTEEGKGKEKIAEIRNVKIKPLPLAEHSELNNNLREGYGVSIKDLKDEQQERNNGSKEATNPPADAETVQQPENDRDGNAGENRPGETTEGTPGATGKRSFKRPDKPGTDEADQINKAHSKIDDWVKKHTGPTEFEKNHPGAKISKSGIGPSQDDIVKWAGEVAKLAVTTGIKINEAFKRWREANPDFLKNFKEKGFNERQVHNEIKTRAFDASVAGEGANPFKELKKSWLGNIWVSHARANSEAANFQDEIKDATPKGQSWKDIDQAIHIYLDTKRNPSHFNQFYNQLTDKQKQIADLSQNLTDQQKDIADRIGEQYTLMSQTAKDAGLIRQALDNYVARAWDFEGKAATELRRKFGISTKHSLKRSLDTILEGWARGYNLKINGATSNLAVLKQEIANVVENRNLIDEGSQTEINDDGDKLFTTFNQDGYKRIDHPNFRKWGYAGKLPEGQDEATFIGKNKDMVVLSDGTVLRKQDVYAPAKVAEQINNIIGTSALRKIGGSPQRILDNLRQANSLIKTTILTSSLFHHLAFSRNRFLTGEIKKGFNYLDGLKAMKENNHILEIGIYNGLTLGKIQDWDEASLHYKGWIAKGLDKFKLTKDISDKISNIAENQKRFLFDKYGAGLKAMDFMATMQREMLKNPYKDPHDIASQVADAMNNNYGGLNLQKMGRNPTVQDAMHFLFLAPDWTESNLRMAVSAFKGGYEGDFTRRMWGKVLLRGASAIALANLAMSLIPDPNDKSKNPVQNMKDRYNKSWDEGNLNWSKINLSPMAHFFGAKKDRDYYFSLLGHYSDPTRLASGIITGDKYGTAQFFLNKGSVIAKSARSFVTGEDWRGQKYTTLDELLGLNDFHKSPSHKLRGKLTKFQIGGSHSVATPQLPSYIIDQVKGTTPTQIQNIWDWGEGQTDGFTALTNSLGLGITSSKRLGKQKKMTKVDVSKILSNK